VKHVLLRLEEQYPGSPSRPGDPPHSESGGIEVTMLSSEWTPALIGG